VNEENGETLDASWREGRTAGARGASIPGLVAVWSAGRATLRAIPANARIELGRGEGASGFDDGRMSRRHAEVWAANGSLHVKDLDSRNGVFVDGAPAREGPLPDGARVLRVGDTFLLLRRDISRFVGAVVTLDGGVVVGPTLAEAHREVESVARSSDVLFVVGETGAGKELAARAFHARGVSSKGPFVAVNCASVPAALAERLLFGARKGAFSGADSDALGLVEAAHGGTLFLDEIAELPLEVQAKLLRVLETRQVTPLGATQAREVKLRLCSAAQSDLREAVGEGRFREDLYYRVARPSVRVPPLRERAEEIPWLLEAALGATASGVAAHASLVEEALLRPWPGNVRELLAEVKEAARRARDAGERIVGASHLAREAGLPFAAAASPETLPGALEASPVEAALRATAGNVTEAARRLGVHRNQLRRWLVQNGVDAARFRGDAGTGAGHGAARTARPPHETN
jgi:transcriptional regulator of acetoin/glycerol metabolism